MVTTEIKSQIAASPKNKVGKSIFSSELRAEVLRYCESSELSLAASCREIGISVGTVHTWLKASRRKVTGSGSFKQIKIQDKPSRIVKSRSLTLTSPSGFSLTGEAEDIASIWRQVDASAFRS